MNITINHIISFDGAALAALRVAGYAVTTSSTEAPVAVPERLLTPARRGRPPGKPAVETPPAETAPPEEQQEAPAGDPGKIRQALRVIIDRGLTADLQEGKGADGKPIVRRRDAIKRYLSVMAPECNGRLRDVPDEKLSLVNMDQMNAIVAS